MAVLAADIQVSTPEGPPPLYLAFKNNTATEIYYRGAVVFTDTGGGVQVVPAAGDLPRGVSPKRQSVTTNDLVSVMVDGWLWMPLGNGVAADDEGTMICLDIDQAQSDNIADWIPYADLTPAANDVALGVITKVETARMLVKIEPYLYNGTLWLAC